MSKKYRIESVMLILLIFGTLNLIGCQGTRVLVENGPPSDKPPQYEKGGPPPWAPAHGYRAKYKYRYYPSHHVYHDSERGLYFYYENGRWQVSVSLPSSIRIHADDYVTLGMDTDKPYEFDDEVVKRYPPGQLKKNKSKKKSK